MTMCSFSDLPAIWRKSAALILASFFLLGHILGIWFSSGASDLFLTTMRMAVSSRVSILGLLSAMVLPFLFSAFAVYSGQPMLLIPIAFVKAFLFSYLGFGIVTVFGNAGWLVTGLTMFGSLSSLPVLCWYWLRHITGRPFELPLFLLILSFLLIIGSVDYYMISPFLAEIITF